MEYCTTKLQNEKHRTRKQSPKTSRWSPTPPGSSKCEGDVHAKRKFRGDERKAP
jgi:hypothetical protein